jgi:rRNA maturation protein Nop10
MSKFDAMSTLKDCPFCGSNRTGGNYTRDGWQAGCNECGARVTSFNPDAIQGAADKWNRRHMEPQRPFSETFSAETVVLGKFFPGETA